MSHRIEVRKWRMVGEIRKSDTDEVWLVVDNFIYLGRFGALSIYCAILSLIYVINSCIFNHSDWISSLENNLVSQTKPSPSFTDQSLRRKSIPLCKVLLHKFVIFTILSSSAEDVQVILKESSYPGVHSRVTMGSAIATVVDIPYEEIEYVWSLNATTSIVPLLSLSLRSTGPVDSIDACTLMAAAWSWVVSFSWLMSCSFVASRSFFSSCWLLKLRVPRNTSFADHVLVDSTGGGMEKFGHKKRG